MRVEFEVGVVEDVSDILRGSRLPKSGWFSSLNLSKLVKPTSRSASCSAGQSSNPLSFTQSIGEFMVHLNYSVKEGVPGQVLSTDRSPWCIAGSYIIK